jgi:hypothetical protein
MILIKNDVRNYNLTLKTPFYENELHIIKNIPIIQEIVHPHGPLTHHFDR